MRLNCFAISIVISISLNRVKSLPLNETDIESRNDINFDNVMREVKYISSEKSLEVDEETHDKSTKRREDEEILMKVRDRLQSSIGIIGAPFHEGQLISGTELGPQFIRENGIIEQLERLCYNDIKDYGDLNFTTKQSSGPIHRNEFTELHNEYEVADAVVKLTETVIRIKREGRFVLTLGGDHSLSTATINGHGLVKNDTSVIYIDAHGDINTCATTRSGNFHGMPVNFIIKEIPDFFPDSRTACPAMDKILGPQISANRFAYIGLRDLDDLEMDIINQLKITYFSMKDIDDLGAKKVINRVLDQINPNCDRPIHVCFDIDAIDLNLAPSTGTTVSGGLSLREAFTIAEEVAKTRLLSALDIMEVNPKIGDYRDVQKTINAAVNIILSFLGKTREALHAQPPGRDHYDINHKLNC